MCKTKRCVYNKIIKIKFVNLYNGDDYSVTDAHEVLQLKYKFRIYLDSISRNIDMQLNKIEEEFNIQEEIMAVKSTCIEPRKNLYDLSKQNIAQAEEISNLERFSRRHNIRIVGVPTKANEN